MGYWEDEFTDESASTYMATYGEGVGFELRHKIASLLVPGEWVLDVGCGPGWNFDHFLEYGPSVCYRGIDASKRFVKVALERVKPLNIFKHGDVRRIPEKDKSFDVVILQDVLEHTNGYKKPLREALRVARRLVIVTFWHLEDSDTPHINDDGDDTWGAWYDKREWEKHLKSLGNDWTHERLEIGGRNRDVYTVSV